MLWRPVGAVNAICMPWVAASPRLRVESVAHSRTVTSGYRRYSHFVPCVDGSELARLFFTFAGWSVQPCVRPVSAAGPLAIMPSADQVPVKTSHSTMRWHLWVVLIAGSVDSALRAFRPPNLHAGSWRDVVQAHAILAILLASAIAATSVGRRANNAVSQGRCLVPWILA
jgi:hypothetical protein